MKKSLIILMTILLTTGSMFFLSSCNIDNNTTPPGTNTTDTDSTGTGAGDTDTGGTDALPGGIVYTGSLPEDLDSVTDTTVFFSYAGPDGSGIGSSDLDFGLLSDGTVDTGANQFSMVYEDDGENYPFTAQGRGTLYGSTEGYSRSYIIGEGINPIDGDIEYTSNSYALNKVYISFASSSSATKNVLLTYDVELEGELTTNELINDVTFPAPAYVTAGIGFGLKAYRMEWQNDELNPFGAQVFKSGATYYELSGTVKLTNRNDDGIYEIVGEGGLLSLNGDDSFQPVSGSTVYYVHETFECSFNVDIEDMIEVVNTVSTNAEVLFLDNMNEGYAKSESQATRKPKISSIFAVDPDDSDAEITIYLQRAE